MTKKKLVPQQKGTKDSRQDFHSHIPGFSTAALNTSPENSSPCLPYSYELPLCYFTSQTTCLPGDHVDGASNSCSGSRNHGELSEHCKYSAFSPELQTSTYKSALPCSSVQEAVTTSESVGRFMPRTTQLQERKRRRDCDRELETNTSSNEVVIGPKLPGLPTVDLQDDSLNTTANLIRSKLKEVRFFFLYIFYIFIFPYIFFLYFLLYWDNLVEDKQLYRKLFGGTKIICLTFCFWCIFPPLFSKMTWLIFILFGSNSWLNKQIYFMSEYAQNTKCSSQSDCDSRFQMLSLLPF